MPNKSPNLEDPIKHVVFLMMENHSFDQMLGIMKTVYPELEGIDPKAPPRFNLDNAGAKYEQRPTTERQMMLDPHHEAEHVQIQLAGQNGGFVKDFSTFYPASTPQDRQCIMGYYPMDFLPALHALAKEFTICDHWHASLPGPTWPNRFFVLTGTTQSVQMFESSQDPELKSWLQETQDTIFDRLDERKIPWKIYYHDIPCSLLLTHQHRIKNLMKYAPIDEFYAAACGPEARFPAFSFIEPRYNDAGQNDDHPPHDVMKAQKLIADVYNAIRSNEDLWRSTLLVVVYDEHGGFYDHVVPPKAVPPDKPRDPNFDFIQYGVRVPALLISPWAKKGVLSTTFDHTSLLRYLIEKWNLRGLTDRVSAATPISLGNLSSPRTDCLKFISIPSQPMALVDQARETAALKWRNSHQKGMAAFKSTWRGRCLTTALAAVRWIYRARRMFA
ncbi:MAG TPA: alkaline phosphatase family protein [Elusimicrobiota bacterium]|nr:alkaline phosphatase family protein [Elusimicrobiota bacterium]